MAIAEIESNGESASVSDRMALATRGLEPDSALSLRAVFDPIFTQADQWTKKAALIHVTSVDQKREMKLARESRLALREIRINAEKARKRLKEDSLRKGKAIDGVYNVIAALIEPIEAHLLEQEQFAERAEAARKDALRSARKDALAAYGTDASIYSDLGAMSDEAWETLIANEKRVHEAKLEAARKAEEERVAREKAEAEAREAARVEAEKREAERAAAEKAQREENARLRREAEEREEKARLDRIAVESRARAEREAIEKKAREERAIAEALAKAEREGRERAEAELAAAKQAEADRLAAEEDARQQAALAPDREKLAALAATLRALPMPTMATERGKAAAAKIAAQIEKLAASIDRAVSTEAP